MRKINLFIVLLCIGMLLLSGCSKKSGGKTPADQMSEIQSYIEYITQYTYGTISRRDKITITLAQDVDLSDTTSSGGENPVAEEILRIKPAIKGKLLWDDARTITLYPESPLPVEREYQATLQLGKLFEVSKELEEFQWSFRTREQGFDLQLDETAFTTRGNDKLQEVQGSIETRDWCEEADVEKILTLAAGDQKPKISWEHDSETNIHVFKITGLVRKEKTYSLALSWNGNAIGVNKKGSQDVNVVGTSEFKYISYKLNSDPELVIRILFSSPVAAGLDLKSFVTVKGDTGPRFITDQSALLIYPSTRHENTVQVTVSKNLKDRSGSLLGEELNFAVTFQQEKPQIKWGYKQGGILPDSGGLMLPFEAVSLRAVDLTVVEIYEDNLVQFLQVNKTITGTSELKRVGRPVLTTTISLDKVARNLSEWNKFHIDLARIVNLKPGSLYQVRLNFRHSQSVYACNDSGEELITDELLTENWDASASSENSNWDYYDDYYYYGDNYWENRNNPCMDEYYGSRRQISMNVLASNLGIIARGNQNELLKVYVSDITTTEPLSGVNVRIYNYQQQELASGKTNASGAVSFQLTQQPFALIAGLGEQRGYLRMDSESALPLSGFDIGGTSAAKGIKGFIYGERGVWRPGDTIYLSFILEDKRNTLPPGHPVIFELRSPKGTLEKRIVSTNGVGGIYNFTTSTAADGETGNWRATVRVGGEVFEKALKIETVKPNRLKINLDFGTQVLKADNKNIMANLEVKWLHGAVAKNLEAEFDLYLSPGLTSFPDYRGFTFDDPTRSNFSSRETIFSGTLNEEGLASFSVDMGETRNAPGVLKASFAGKVFEEGGNFSIDKIDIPYYPYTSFTGIKIPPGDKARGMLLTDEDHKVEIVTVDSDGKPLSREGLQVELYKLSWRWWWDKSSEDTANYLRKEYLQREGAATINTKNGKGEYVLRIDYPSWGRYFLRVTDPASGHSSGQIFYIDWPGWAGTAQREGMGGATMLSFFTDNSEYNTGDTVTVTIPGGAAGRALLSLETGSRIVDSYWVETKQGMNTFTFKATTEMSPNVYIHITLLQPHLQVSNDLPLRLYGIFPIKVIDPATRLEPELKVPGTLAPEKEVVIKVSEKQKRDMAYTLAVVDEGLLDLTHFTTPDSWSAMYQKEALGIAAWDIYDDVLGAVSDEFGHLLTIGGGDDNLPPKDQSANRFEPVVKFFGPFFLEGGREATHKFTMPRYIGAVKTMVVAANQGAYGRADTSSFVKESLMVLGTLPRVLGPGEKIKLPVNVFVLDEKIREVDVKVSTAGPLKLAGNGTARLKFTSPGDQFVYFDLVTPAELGIATVAIEVASGSEKASYEVELDVRPSNPIETRVVSYALEPGKSWKYQAELIGLKGTNSQTLEASFLPSLNLDERLSFLIHYPHGCIEQTTSAVFPQLFLDRLTDLEQKQRDEITDNVTAGIQQLKKFQTSGGGFAYWPGNEEPSAWGSCYAGHFLCEARTLGYNIPGDLLSAWSEYQRREANKWRSGNKNSDDFIQAYRLYTLALAGSPELGAMNRLREVSGLEVRARWRLAAAYALAGKQDVARELVDGQSTAVADYNASSATYGSAQRDKAMILETFSYLSDPAQGYTLLLELAGELGSKKWFSTQSTAYSLLAIARYGAAAGKQESLSCTYKLGSQTATLTTDKSLLQHRLTPEAGTLEVTNPGQNVIYLSFITRGIPLKGQETEGQQNIKLELTYRTKEGKTVSDPGSLPQGTDMVIESRITNNGAFGDLEELALTQILPPGWEILNARLQGLEDYKNFDKPEYLDIRDDRVYTYFDLQQGQTRTFAFIVNVAYLGEYYLPGTVCEAMYNNQVFARLKGRTIAISK